jgi:hypothetical protein
VPKGVSSFDVIILVKIVFPFLSFCIFPEHVTRFFDNMLPISLPATNFSFDFRYQQALKL